MAGYSSSDDVAPADADSGSGELFYLQDVIYILSACYRHL